MIVYPITVSKRAYPGVANQLIKRLAFYWDHILLHFSLSCILQ